MISALSLWNRTQTHRVSAIIINLYGSSCSAAKDKIKHYQRESIGKLFNLLNEQYTQFQSGPVLLYQLFPPCSIGLETH